MSVLGPTHGQAPGRAAEQPARPREMTQLRARRRAAERRRRLARLDLALGVAGALILLLVTPGLAVAAMLSGVILLGCGLSIIAPRLWRRRRGR